MSEVNGFDQWVLSLLSVHIFFKLFFCYSLKFYKYDYYHMRENNIKVFLTFSHPRHFPEPLRGGISEVSREMSSNGQVVFMCRF